MVSQQAIIFYFIGNGEFARISNIYMLILLNTFTTINVSREKHVIKRFFDILMNIALW